MADVQSSQLSVASSRSAEFLNSAQAASGPPAPLLLTGCHAERRHYRRARDSHAILSGSAWSAASDGSPPWRRRTAAAVNEERLGASAHTVTPVHLHARLPSPGRAAGCAHSAPRPDSTPAAAALSVYNGVSIAITPPLLPLRRRSTIGGKDIKHQNGWRRGAAAAMSAPQA